MELPKRKSPRIPGYDYSRDNYYFITVCTHEKRCIFGEAGKPNRLGQIAAEDLCQLSAHYPGVKVEKSVVMPNHIHAIIILGCEKQTEALPDLSVVIGQYKSGVTRKIRSIVPELEVWQRSYHDHVIRSRADYEKIWAYIDTNPQRWRDDCFFAE